MHSLSSIWRLSRPRFWLYLAGPFVVGYVASMPSILSLESAHFWVSFLLWLIPANIFLYGVNDLADYDTDQFNTKKTHQETRISNQATHYRKSIWAVLGVAVGLLLIWATWQSWVVLIATLVFLGLGAGYSLPPIRFKARAGWDSYSNILYVVPGIIGFLLHFPEINQVSLNLMLAVIAGGAFSVAMHAFSAIPDIEPDRRAGITTIAVALGRHKTLLFCLSHWLIMLSIGLYLLGPVALLALPYLLLPLWLLTQSTTTLSQSYWWFPYLNSALGAILFGWIVLLRFNPLTLL